MNDDVYEPAPRERGQEGWELRGRHPIPDRSQLQRVRHEGAQPPREGDTFYFFLDLFYEFGWRFLSLYVDMLDLRRFFVVVVQVLTCAGVWGY